MKRSPGLLALALALATLTGGHPVRAQDVQGGTGHDQPDVGPRTVQAPYQPREAAVPASLQDVFRRLATSWEAEDARAIAQLARDGRVYVQVQRDGVAERLAASQLQYLLEELFERSSEVTFRFPAYASYDPSSGTGYAVGERVYQDGSGLAARVDRVFAGARSERGRWVLTELRLTTD